MRSYAIIPAAGRSQRMGQPKLLLPWGSSTLIEHVLGAWRASRIAQTVIVVHPHDERLAELSRECGAVVVQPQTAPSDMKVSVRLGLERIERDFHPLSCDAWLLAPADMPGISPLTIDRLIGAYQSGLDRAEPAQILAPRSAGRRGHPVLFPWRLAAEVKRLAADEGINAIVARHTVAYLDDADESVIEDLDTPEDYERLRARYGAQRDSARDRTQTPPQSSRDFPEPR
ncbi:MAG TPA: nucleotidyltransferase family protein [Pirellulales bacterium]|nr:nucleotidyltransferase family protein [Pirellulales bacterium]